jgi:hypothetical protein
VGQWEDLVVVVELHGGLVPEVEPQEQQEVVVAMGPELQAVPEPWPVHFFAAGFCAVGFVSPCSHHMLQNYQSVACEPSVYHVYTTIGMDWLDGQNVLDDAH